MPHGQYQGEELEQIPSDYLHWVATDWDDDTLATAADEEYNDEERIREELRELKYEKTFDCKYCGKCPTIHSPIRCEDVMNDYWQEFAALSQEEKQEIYFTEHNFIGDWKHTRCHDAGVICAGLNANYNDAKYQWQTLRKFQILQKGGNENDQRKKNDESSPSFFGEK